ncbi:MAG: substrate-binding domain-containing protein [Flavobacteriales bacterium]|nr:substrate-binding domain-containing protein [Flavobacteriales bacterium]MCB0757919.1 substrate-binding domain-containing protein [Flavobacteriales bacterium]
MSNRISIIPGICILLLAGCRSAAPDPGVNDTPTQGRILVLADMDCRPVIEKEHMIFSSFYPKAEVTVRYLNEADLLKAMLNDSVRCVFTSVDLGGEQQAWFRQRNLSTPIIPIYKGGIAVVVNKESPLHHLDLGKLAKLLGGTNALEVTADEEGSLGLDSMTALFAGAGSGVARLLVDSLRIGKLRGRALADVPAVVAQVARDPRTIGFLPFEAISDLDNPQMRALRDQVRLLPIARRADDPPVLPSQSTLADGAYPLQRTVHAILTEGKSGLGTGFVSFVANHKGQRIILKLGVAPINIPTRNVEIVPY